MTLEEEKRRAEEAAFILDSKVYHDVIAELDEAYVQKWRGASSPEARESAWQMQRALKEVDLSIQAIITGYKLKNRRENHA